jgi:tRNA pseudouridine32 synthase/23S rRNA pseudouridine746 synthase
VPLSLARTGAADAPLWLHVDEALIAADKPAGLLAVPGRGADKADCLWARVRDTYADALVVHRLDMATSGLMLFARGAAAQRALARDFAAGRVHKAYVAVVAGRLEGDEGRIGLPVGADWPRRPRQQVDHDRGRAALTLWRRIGGDAHTTRLALQPVTGRTHQLRVHLAAIGHPIVGDALYAPADIAAAAPRLLLHAAGVELVHPRSGAALRLVCPVPF